MSRPKPHQTRWGPLGRRTLRTCRPSVRCCWQTSRGGEWQAQFVALISWSTTRWSVWQTSTTQCSGNYETSAVLATCAGCSGRGDPMHNRRVMMKWLVLALAAVLALTLGGTAALLGGEYS